MPRILSILFALLFLAYPVLVYVGLDSFRPSVMGWTLAAVGCARILLLLTLQKQASDTKSFFTACMLALAGTAYALTAYEPALLLYPVIINIFMLTLFASSVLYPPTVIERLARFRHPDLPQSANRYLRGVTIAWCIFFILNGMAALACVLFLSRANWTLYNGLIAYILMAMMFAGEMCVRHFMMKRKIPNSHDGLGSS